MVLKPLICKACNAAGWSTALLTERLISEPAAQGEDRPAYNLPMPATKPDDSSSSAPTPPELRQPSAPAIAESELRLELLIDAVLDYSIFMLDPNGRIVKWNRGAQRLYGYPANAILNAHFSIFYSPEDLA